MIDSVVNSMADYMVDCMTDCMTDSAIDSVIDYMADYMADYLADYLVGCRFDFAVDCIADFGLNAIGFVVSSLVHSGLNIGIEIGSDLLTENFLCRSVDFVVAVAAVASYIVDIVVD